MKFVVTLSDVHRALVVNSTHSYVSKCDGISKRFYLSGENHCVYRLAVSLGRYVGSRRISRHKR